MGGFSGVLRVWALGLLAAAIWFLSVATYAPPTPAPLNAPADRFSAARAYQTLLYILGSQRPHPAGTAENAAVRARIRAQFARLGVSTSVYRGTGCEKGRRIALVVCGTVTDILADVRPGQGKAILLLAHYDSVPAGPGAADDESGVATVLETVRALKAAPQSSRHPILALITDGEEYGLLGADSFLHNPARRARVGAVINVEARGNQGPSLLFQTSPGAEPLIDLYAGHVRHYATSSLFAEIYKRLPNDTDLTLFIRDQIPSLNFAFSGNVAHYHTPLDTAAHLSLASLQHQGENMLGMARALEGAGFAQLQGSDAIYVTVLGRFLPRMPAAWALPLAIAGFVVIALSFFLGFGGRARMDVRDWLLLLFMPPALMIGCVAAGFGLHGIAQLVSGQPDPSYAFPDALRIGLALGVWVIALLVARTMRIRIAAIACWLWFAGLAIATAIFIPGLSPYFLFPVLIAAVLFLIAALLRTGPGPTRAVLLLAALPALILWIGLAASGEGVMGLRLHPLFTVTAAFALLTLLAVMDVRAITPRAWVLSISVALIAAIAASVVQGLQPAFSLLSPQRLNLAYLEDHSAKRASWIADAGAPLPGTLRAAAPFSETPKKPYAWAFGDAYIASAGAMHFAPPQVHTRIAGSRGGLRQVVLTLNGSLNAARMFVVVPKSAGLKGAALLQRTIMPNPGWTAQDTVIGCVTPQCRSAQVTLLLSTKRPVTLTVAEQDPGLPPFGAKLLAARPATAVQSQMGDTTIITRKIAIPGG